jgi:hypothetical protein
MDENRTGYDILADIRGCGIYNRIIRKMPDKPDSL